MNNFVFTLILLIVLYYTFTLIYKFFPASEIPLKLEKVYKTDINLKSDKDLRKFNVLDSDTVDEINEIFLNFDETIEENFAFLFKGFICKCKNKLQTIQPNQLVYFSENNLGWNSDCYFYSDTGDIIYPETNSIFISKKPFKYHGKDINVIIGEKL